MQALGPGPGIDTLIERQRAGFSLEQAFYVRPDIFELEIDRIFSRQWLLAGLEISIPEPGEYFLYSIAGESIIVIRGRDREVRAFFNVCRHRGSRICLQPRGKVSRLVCRYHAWAYDLDGKLAAWRHMPVGLDPADYGLHRCHVRLFGGLIFVCLGEEDPPPFGRIESDVGPFLEPHDLANSKIALCKEFPTKANWKLVMENFVECYHCQSSHPEFTAANAYVKAEEGVSEQATAAYADLKSAWRARATQLGYVTHEVASSGDGRGPRYAAYRYPLRKGFRSGTRDGEPAAPLMGRFTEHDGAFTVMAFCYFGTVIAANDYAAVLQFSPQDANFTRVRVTWLVARDAKEGRDYDPREVSWLWDVTTQQDTDIIERNAEGVASIRYRPGPYSALEWSTDEFIRWYLRQLC